MTCSPINVVQTPQQTMMNGIHNAGRVRFIIMFDGTSTIT
jgi:hypothetical protein